MRTILSSSLLLFFISTPLFAQGSLEPASPPGPTMKTLDQLEPRTPVSAAETIANSGSYYLTKNITGSIVITADDVTLDLNGFTLSGGNPHGIVVSNTNNVRIFNGTIMTPTNVGVYGLGLGNIHLQDLRISGGGECVALGYAKQQATVSQINCSETLKSGITVFSADNLAPLIALIHDNVVHSTNTDAIAPGASIRIGIFETNEESYVDIRNNRVYDSGLDCILVFSDENVASEAGTITENTTSSCKTGLIVAGDFIVTKNLSQKNETADYDLTAAPSAAPVSSINASPGPWDNIRGFVP